jgi:hypothetical protein
MDGHWPLVGAGVLCAVIASSDFVSTTNRFWSGHQVLTGMATQLGLALVAIVGLDRLIAKRESKKWRPLALMVVKRLEQGIDDFDQTLQRRTLGYCLDRYGAWEVPVGREYPEIATDALFVKSTWEPIAEYPDLVTELAELVEESKSKLETWAPLLVADPNLAEIGACATTIHDKMEKGLSRLVVLWMAFDFRRPASGLWYAQNHLVLLTAVALLRQEVERFHELAEEFRQV